jgi:hypothetical protein
MFIADGGVMKRFLIFAALWPILGLVWGFWIVLQISNRAVGAPLSFDYQEMNLLPMAYMAGIIPALLLAWFDEMLARRHASYRISWTALAAYLVSYVPLLGVYALPLMHDHAIWLVGIIGAVPGAICAWLATDEAEGVIRRRDKSPIGQMNRML